MSDTSNEFNVVERVSSVFSDRSEVENDRFNSIAELIIKGKKALKSGGGLLVFKKKLVKNLNILSEKNVKEIPTLDLEDEYQTMLVDNWIEEIIKFLALKTITGDITEPCQLLPGHAIGVGWKVLMTNPSSYSKVCLAMGNQHVFDHHPSDTAASRVQEKHKVKRYNATLRAYESYFDQQPHSLYWSFYPKEKEEEVLVPGFLRALCGCDFDGSFLSNQTEAQTKTREQVGMSPNMPLLV